MSNIYVIFGMNWKLKDLELLLKVSFSIIKKLYVVKGHNLPPFYQVEKPGFVLPGTDAHLYAIKSMLIFLKKHHAMGFFWQEMTDFNQTNDKIAMNAYFF